MGRLNSELRSTVSLINEGIIGEQFLSEKLQELLNDTNYVVEIRDDEAYEFYDLTSINKTNSKRLLIESEKYTSKVKLWNKPTEQMFVKDFHYSTVLWPFGLNIVSRKIIELEKETNIPKLNKNGEYIFKHRNNEKPYDLFIKISPDCKYFFAIQFDTLKSMVENKQIELKINHKNSKEKNSNTNDVFMIDVTTAYTLIKNKKLLLDDWNKLITGIKILLK